LLSQRRASSERGEAAVAVAVAVAVAFVTVAVGGARVERV
jgi:hypothetical protein